MPLPARPSITRRTEAPRQHPRLHIPLPSMFPLVRRSRRLVSKTGLYQQRSRIGGLRHLRLEGQKQSARFLSLPTEESCNQEGRYQFTVTVYLHRFNSTDNCANAGGATWSTSSFSLHHQLLGSVHGAGGNSVATVSLLCAWVHWYRIAMAISSKRRWREPAAARLPGQPRAGTDTPGRMFLGQRLFCRR